MTLFGHAVAQPLYKNSSAGSSGYKGEYCISLYDALKDAGFNKNDLLFDAYATSSTSRSTESYSFQTNTTTEYSAGEETIDFYTDELQAFWKNDYNDVAIIMLSREGEEDCKFYIEDTEEISQFALHQDEKDLLELIRSFGKFEKTILLCE